MKCHYAHVDGKKYLVPYCWEVINSNDISDCTCLNVWGQMVVDLKKQGKTEELKELRQFLKENNIKQTND